MFLLKNLKLNNYKMKNLKVSTKLFVIIAFVLGGGLATGTYGFIELYNLKTNLNSIFDNSFGGRQLIILQEGDTVSDALVCRIMHDEPQVTIMDYNYEQHVLDMESLAYIKDGEVF